MKIALVSLPPALAGCRSLVLGGTFTSRSNQDLWEEEDYTNGASSGPIQIGDLGLPMPEEFESDGAPVAGD